MSLIKTITRESRSGKRRESADRRGQSVFRTAEHALYDELAAALETESEKIRDYIIEKIGN